MLNRSFIIVVWLLLLQSLVRSETSIDSLQLILNNELSLAEKHKSVLELAKELNWKKPIRAMELTDTLRSLEMYRTDSSLIMQLRSIDAKALRGRGNYDESIALYTSNFAYYQRHLDSIGMAGAAGQIGLMNNFNGNTLESQEWLLLSHDLYQKVGSIEQKAGSNNALAIYYMDLDQREKGYERYLMALEEYNQANDMMGAANVNANLGLAYIEDKKFEKAEFHLMEQGRLDSIIDTKWGLGFHHDFMGYLRMEQGRLDEAQISFITALNIRKELSSHYNIAESRVSLAGLYVEMEKFDEAIFHANKVFDHQDKSKSLTQQQSAHEVLSRAYEAIGDNAQALKSYKNYKIISDSILNRDMLEQVTEKDAKFSRAEQDNEIALLNAKNSANEKILGAQRRALVVGGIALFFISILSFFLWKLYQKVKLQNSVISSTLEDKKILLREIHHRVKNNLQIISSLLNLQSKNIKDEKVAEAIQEGKARVRSMALIHQDLYQQEHNLLGVSVKSYLQKLCNELFSTYSVSPDRINLDLDIADIDLEVESLVPLGLILNELITNSIKYAFPDERVGSIDISLKEDQDSLILRVADDGIGMDYSMVNEKKSFGHFLIRTLSKQLQGKYDVQGDNGTVFEMRFTKYKMVG